MLLSSTLLALVPALALASPLALRRQASDIPEGSVFPDPPGDARRVHPYGRNDLCMMVEGGYLAEGAAVGIAYCVPDNGTYANLQLWNVPSDYSGLFRVNGTSFCLDLGGDANNGDGAHVETCGDDEVNNSQTFVYQDDQIRKQDSNQCADVRVESQPTNHPPYSTLKQLQAWECAGNENQVFTLYDGE